MKIASTVYISIGRLIYFILFPLFVVYPSTRTRGLIFDQEGRILLVKNWIGNNSWDTPGGGLHHGESLPECLTREVYEETGIKINEEDWQFITKRHKQLTQFVYFAAVTHSQAITCQKREITAAAWFGLDALPSKRNAFVDQILSAYDERTLS